MLFKRLHSIKSSSSECAVVKYIIIAMKLFVRICKNTDMLGTKTRIACVIKNWSARSLKQNITILAKLKYLFPESFSWLFWTRIFGALTFHYKDYGLSWLINLMNVVEPAERVHPWSASSFLRNAQIQANPEICARVRNWSKVETVSKNVCLAEFSNILLAELLNAVNLLFPFFLSQFLDIAIVYPLLHH